MKSKETSVLYGLMAAVSAVSLIGLLASAAHAQSIPASVEDVAPESNLIVLGRVISTDPDGVEMGGDWKMLFTRHTFRVEAYYKGSGPKEISLFTPGGFETRVVDGKERRLWNQVTGSEQAKDGEEFLAFLRQAPLGYVFAEWDGAKYMVERDSETEERTLHLRLRKKKYMRGLALQGFERLERVEAGPDQTAKVEAKLKGSKSLHDIITVKDLPERLAEIIRGETTPSVK